MFGLFAFMVFGSVSASIPSLGEQPVRIASFHIDKLGQTKYDQTSVRNCLIEIFSRYDIIQVLDIRDGLETVFEALRGDLNTYMANMGQTVTYGQVQSDRLGSVIHQQYGFLYRTNLLSVVGTHQMSDIDDKFEWEPFGVKFSSPTIALEDFVMVALNTEPLNTFSEINQLPNIYSEFAQEWDTEDILISGNFNAHCSFLTQPEWDSLATRGDPAYHWLFDNLTDTTTGYSSCSYDKFVATGQFADNVVERSVAVYPFDKEWNLNESEALEISKHYPIELKLKGKSHTAVQQHLQSKTSFVVKDNEQVNVNDINNIFSEPSCVPSGFVTNLQTDFVTATITSLIEDEVMDVLLEFKDSCNGTLSANLMGMVNGYMEAHYLGNNVPQVNGLVLLNSHTYEIDVKCWLLSPHICEVMVSYSISGAP